MIASPNHITHLKAIKRTKGSSRAHSSTAAATKAPDLASRSCAVLWDLDNLHPGSANVLPAINEVRDLLACLGLQQAPSVTCYANTTTTSRLGASPHPATMPSHSLCSSCHSLVQLTQPTCCCRGSMQAAALGGWCRAAASAVKAAGSRCAAEQ
jgi:hypothetical protein